MHLVSARGSTSLHDSGLRRLYSRAGSSGRGQAEAVDLATASRWTTRKCTADAAVAPSSTRRRAAAASRLPPPHASELHAVSCSSRGRRRGGDSAASCSSGPASTRRRAAAASSGRRRASTEPPTKARTDSFRVIEHKPYDHKADVFSFGILTWELLTGKIPYEYLTPLQAAVGVVQKGLRPTIPKHTHARLSELLQKCWQQDPAQRPDFSEILETLKRIAELELRFESIGVGIEKVGDEHEGKHKDKTLGSFLSALRGRSH